MLNVGYLGVEVGENLAGIWFSISDILNNLIEMKRYVDKNDTFNEVIMHLKGKKLVIIGGQVA
ncbi:hypothetical protein [Legionella shakespearei]|uniref:hypothetical protein n=1 Tax=Legionella shakespearei TaxID=45075 RepID=UPI00036E7DBD|nr:hypothetical protein [Legionella shakespearei]